jgi:hypothetical protein
MRFCVVGVRDAEAQRAAPAQAMITLAQHHFVNRPSKLASISVRVGPGASDMLPNTPIRQVRRDRRYLPWPGYGARHIAEPREAFKPVASASACG